MMNCFFKMMNCVLKMMNYVSNMMQLITDHKRSGRRGVPAFEVIDRN